MRAETGHLVAHVIRENLPIHTLLDADYTFLNERLAKHYGYPDVSGNGFRKVALASPRRGILGHASILTLTSYPTRTSPVIRGKYILDNILNTPPPPPPQNVPPLEARPRSWQKLPLREQLERHRSDPACSSCHALMDPLGFGLENFDAVGRWRESENGHRIDTSGTLADGRASTALPNFSKSCIRIHKTAFCAPPLPKCSLTPWAAVWNIMTAPPSNGLSPPRKKMMAACIR